MSSLSGMPVRQSSMTAERMREIDEEMSRWDEETYGYTDEPKKPAVDVPPRLVVTWEHVNSCWGAPKTRLEFAKKAFLATLYTVACLALNILGLPAAIFSLGMFTKFLCLKDLRYGIVGVGRMVTGVFAPDYMNKFLINRCLNDNDDFYSDYNCQHFYLGDFGHV